MKVLGISNDLILQGGSGRPCGGGNWQIEINAEHSGIELLNDTGVVKIAPNSGVYRNIVGQAGGGYRYSITVTNSQRRFVQTFISAFLSSGDAALAAATAKNVAKQEV